MPPSANTVSLNPLSLNRPRVTPHGDETVLRQALCASSAIRRSADPRHALELLVSTVLLIIPQARVWAGRRGTQTPMIQARAADPAPPPDVAQVPDLDVPALLNAMSVRLGEGEPAFEIELDQCPTPVTVCPMTSPGGVGALVLDVSLRELSVVQRSVLCLLAEQTAAALDLMTARTAATQTRALFQTLTALTASYSDAGLVLQTIASSATTLLGTDAAFVMMLDEDRTRLRVRTAHGITTRSFYEATSRIDEALPGAAIRRRRVVCVQDLQSHDRARYSKPEGLRSVMCAPMFVEDQLLGVLLAAHREIRELSQEDRRVMAALANAAAISIKNARLYAEREDSIRRLGEANRLLEERSAAQVRTMQFQQRLTALVLNGAPLEELVTAVADTLGCVVLVLDRDLTVLHHSARPSQAADGETEIDLAELRSSLTSSGPALAGVGVSRLTVRSGGSDLQTYVAPLDLGGERTAYVVVIEGDAGLDSTDFGMTQSAVTAIGLELMRDRASAETEARLAGGLFQSLLSSDGHDDAAVGRRASYLGYELSGRNVVIAVTNSNKSGVQSSALHGSLEACVRRAARRGDGACAVFERDDSVYVVLSGYDAPSPAAIRQLCSAIRQEYLATGRAGAPRIAFAGPHPGVAGVRQAVQEATYTLRVAEILGRSGTPMAFGELGYGPCWDGSVTGSTSRPLPKACWAA